MKIKNLINKIKDFLEQEKVITTSTLVLYIILYGILINFMLWSIWNISFTITSFIGYGILFYLIKEEFVRWIRRIIAKR